MARPNDTRDRLLAAAIDLIWTHSYGSVGVDQICEQAGVHKGSFYHFFPSKTDLVLAAYEAHWESVRPELDAIFSPLVPPRERIERWCEGLYAHQKALHKRYGHVCGCPYANVGTELGTQDERIRSKVCELFNRAQTYLESALRELLSDTHQSASDIRHLAQAIHSFELGLLIRAKVSNDPEILRELGPAIRQMLRSAETSSSLSLNPTHPAP
jgi:TetR/AcrR family transcriptional repressor of nem operon